MSEWARYLPLYPESEASWGKDFDDVAALPDDFGIGEDLARAEQRVSLRFDSETPARRRRDRQVGRMELRGEHCERLLDALVVEGIDVAD